MPAAVNSETDHLLAKGSAASEPLSRRSSEKDSALRVANAWVMAASGVVFFLGSVCYLPEWNKRVLGAWLFAVGSVGFMYSDVSAILGVAKAGRVAAAAQPDTDLAGGRSAAWLLRFEQGLNSLTSLAGNFLYLAGSILFIPSYPAEHRLGTIVFIAGSGALIFAQGWKLLRYAKPAAFKIEGAFGLGATAYLIGSVLVLPVLCNSAEDIELAARAYVVGGTCFLYGSLAVAYGYM